MTLAEASDSLTLHSSSWMWTSGLTLYIEQGVRGLALKSAVEGGGSSSFASGGSGLTLRMWMFSVLGTNPLCR